MSFSQCYAKQKINLACPKSIFFKKYVTFPSLLCLYSLVWEKICSIFRKLLLLYTIYVLDSYQDYFLMLGFTDTFSSLNHQAYWKKKIWSKCCITISNFLKKLVWLLSFWIEYGNNDQLSFFPEFKFNVYLCNLRWCHFRFQTLMRCYGGIFNFLTLKIWEIDLLGTCYIYTNFQTCSICRTAEPEMPIPSWAFLGITHPVLHWCCKLHLKLPQK